MVTGVEAAGLALAILPLIVNQADNYVQGLETLKTFRSRKYRRDMESYYNSLSTQRTILENVLERCFQGVVKYEEDISELINNPLGPSWYDPTFQNMLSKKLDRNFNNFVRTVTELAGLLEEFSQKLGLLTADSTKTPETLWKDSSMAEREIKKIKDILSKSIYAGYIEKIKSANSTLQTLVEQSEYRENIWQKRRLPKRQLLCIKTAQKIARSLYDIISRREFWNCKCRDQHRAQIQLDVFSRSDFSETPEIPKFRMMLTSKASSEPSDTWHWQEVETESSFNDSQPREAKLALKKAKIPVVRQAKVKFAVVTMPLQSVPRPKIESIPCGSPIENLCAALCAIKPNSIFEERKLIGFLTDDNHRHTIYAVGDSSLNLELQSLEAVLMSSSDSKNIQGSSKLVLRRRDRLRLAASLASSILQFHGSWMKTHWRTKDIMLRASELGNKAPDSIYLAQQTPENAYQPGKPVSQQNSLSTHLIRNEILFPLGLALVELSLGQTIASLRKPEDDDPVEAVANLKTALRNLPDVRNESGILYEEVVDKCFFWPGRKDIKFDDEDFQRTMFESIVSPLLEDLKHFEGQYRVH